MSRSDHDRSFDSFDSSGFPSPHVTSTFAFRSPAHTASSASVWPETVACSHAFPACSGRSAHASLSVAIIAAAFVGVLQQVQCLPTRIVLSGGRETVSGSGCAPSRIMAWSFSTAFPAASTSSNFTCAQSRRTFRGAARSDLRAAGHGHAVVGLTHTAPNALIAVARKLLVIANSAIRGGRVWDGKMAAGA